MTTDEFRAILVESGYSVTSIRQKWGYLPCLAIETYDPMPLVEYLLDWLGYCPTYKWIVRGGKGYLCFEDYTEV